jgi:hypothetical protein
MNCAYCERSAVYEAWAGLQRLRLCDFCAAAWMKRTACAPLPQWLRQLKPAPRTRTQCPFCHTTQSKSALRDCTAAPFAMRSSYLTALACEG